MTLSRIAILHVGICSRCPKVKYPLLPRWNAGRVKRKPKSVSQRWRRQAMTRAVATRAKQAPPNRVIDRRTQLRTGFDRFTAHPYGGNQASSDAKFISNFDIHMRRITCGYVHQSQMLTGCTSTDGHMHEQSGNLREFRIG
jgi:hypothetical protein